MPLILALVFTGHPIALLLVLALLHWPVLWVIVILLAALIGVVLLIVAVYATWAQPRVNRRRAARHARDIEEFRAKLPTY